MVLKIEVSKDRATTRQKQDSDVSSRPPIDWDGQARTQINAPGMWRTITPHWELWVHHLELFPYGESWRRSSSHRSIRHVEDNKDVLLGQEERRAWQLWEEKVKQFKKRRQQGTAPIFFTSEMEVLGHVLAGVKQDESCTQVEQQSREKVARIQAVKRKKQKAEAATGNQQLGALRWHTWSLLVLVSANAGHRESLVSDSGRKANINTEATCQ